jgi:hypothetical protein
MDPWTTLPPWVGDLVEKIFKSKIDSQDPYPIGWVVLLGEIAWHHFLHHAGEWVKVGIQENGLRVAQVGAVGPTTILGIECRRDEKGPPTQWRLQEADGSTLAWGEIP